MTVDYEATEAALLDSGFDGYLVVPETLAARFPAPTSLIRVGVAGGGIVYAPTYPGVLEFLEQAGPFPVDVLLLGDEYLVGLAAMNRFRITFDHGEQLTVQP